METPRKMQKITKADFKVKMLSPVASVIAKQSFLFLGFQLDQILFSCPLSCIFPRLERNQVVKLDICFLELLKKILQIIEQMGVLVVFLIEKHHLAS